MKGLGAWTVVAVFAGMGALGLGCGGSDGGSDDQSSTVAVTVNPSISQAEYRQQANAICTEGKTASLDIAVRRAEKAGKASVQELPDAELTEIFLSEMNKQLSALSELGAPPNAKDRVETFLNAFHEAIDKIEEEGLEGQDQIQPALKPIYDPAEAVKIHWCAYGG